MGMRTLAGTARVEVEIKRSRFVAHAGRVESLADTLAFYEAVADPDASHNCWAWRLDHQYRFNDDGEPSSSAGRPILTAIEGKGLDQAMVVVTRYYGGIKLGVGGLIRAYSGSAARSIDLAGMVEIEETAEILVRAPFAETGNLHQALAAASARKLGEEFGDQGVVIRAEVPQKDLEKLRGLLRDLTRGAATVSPAD